MARTVPAAIAALVGQVNIRVLWLVKWELNTGTRYYSSGPSVSFGGNTYEANRIRTVSSVVAQYVDRKRRDFPRLSITFDNLADNSSSSFPFTLLDAAEIFEDKKLTVYAYFPDQGEGLEVWWGYSGRPKFEDGEKTVEVTGSFLWDSRELVVPSKSLPQAGFETLETNRNKDPLALDIVLPLVYGVSNFKIRPTIYSARVEAGQFYVNFIISGTAAGLPFQTNDITPANCRLFGTAPALSVEFHPGGTDIAPTNFTRFPDGIAHNDVAYGVAVFAITEQIKDKLDDIEPHDIKLTVANGRKLIDTSLPSENPVLILKDVLRDPLYGLGLANASFDSTAVSAAASYASSKWQARLELHERMSIGDFVQAMCTDIHGYITFNNGLIQIGCKNNSEGSVATFATIDSGFGGRKIHEDRVESWEEDGSEVINQVRIEYRKKNHQKRELIMYDPAAQARAGLNIKKVSEESVEILSLYLDGQVQISGATTLREELNGNLFISFASPIVEGLLPAPGDVITVRSPGIFNNASNHEFRIIAQTFELGDEPLCRFTCQVYKPAIYDYSTAGIGFDLLRGGEDTSLQGRPPDVIPVSLQIKDVVANDTEGKLATVLAMWTYPTVDLAAEQADGIFREYPIGSVQLWWHYTDESENEARMGKEIKYPTAQGEFQIDYHKNRSIKVWFVALGHNRSRAKLGMEPDSTKASALQFDLGATAGTGSIINTAAFNVNDYTFIENEINRVFSKTAGTITFYPGGGGSKVAFFNTTAIAHPVGTEIAVAKESYPSLTLPLTAPRFTYKVVTGLVARQKSDGVRAKWNDVDAANREVYLLYWSTEADAGTNPAKLGISTPAWYLSNPEAPPAGINLSKNDDLAHLIDRLDIGGTDIPVFVRVAARNGKHNFSVTLSTLETNAAGGSLIPDPTDAPSTPHASLIISQAPNLATSVADSKDVFRVFASQANNSLTFAQTGTRLLILIFRDAGDTKDDPWPFVIDDQSVTFVDVPVIGTLGKSRIHRRNVADNGAGGRTKSPVVSIPFFAGGKVTSLAGITGLAITSIVPIANSKGRKSDVNYTFTQPNPAALIAKAFVMQKNSAEAVFSKEAKNPLLDEETMQLPGVKTDVIRVGHPKNDAGQYKIRLVSVDGTTLESAIFNSTSQEEDTAPPNNGVAITVNRAKLKGKGLVVDFVLPVAQMNTHEKNVLIIHDDNSTGAGRKFFDIVTGAWVATYPDGSTELAFGKGGFPSAPIDKSALYSGGRTTAYLRVGVWNRFNGGSATYSGDLSTPITQAGSDGDPLATDNAVPSSLSTPFLNADKGRITARNMRADANNVTEQYKEVVFEIVTAADAQFTMFDPDTGTITGPEKRLNIGKSGHKTVKVNRRQLKADLGTANFNSFRIRAYYYVANSFGTSAKSPNSASLALATLFDTIADDIDIPSAPPAPTIKYKNDHFIIFIPRPTANINTLSKMEVTIRIDNSGGGTIGYITSTGNTWAASGSQVWLDAGLSGEFHINLSKAQLQSLFSGAFNIVSASRASNSITTSTFNESSLTNRLLSDIKGHLNTREVPSVLDVGTTLNTPVQILENGDMLYSITAGGASVDKWKRRQTPFTSRTNITTTNTENAWWDKNNHAIVWRSNLSRIDSNLHRRFLPGEYFTITFMAKTDGSFGVAPVVVLRIRRDDTTDDTEAAVSIPLTAISTTFKMYGGILRLSTSAGALTADKFLSFETVATLSATNNIIIDKIMGVRGQQPFAFSPRPIFEQGPGSTLTGLSEDFDNASFVSTGTPDISPASGLGGGFFPPGSGGGFAAL